MSKHVERLKATLLKEIAFVIRGSLRDPRIPGMVTLTEINLSQDRRNAVIFASIMGDDEERASAINALNHAAPFIQRSVAPLIRMKHFPHVVFKLDRSMDYSAKINSILETIKDDLERD